MPPRFAYWTILIDNTATAFRAQHADDLLPTLVQLRRTNKDVVMKWFARGRMWESPEAARAALRKPKVSEKRGRDWRPGGRHKDPRARFDRRTTDRDTPRTPGPVESAARANERRPGPRGHAKGYSRPWGGKKPRGKGERPHNKPRDQESRAKGLEKFRSDHGPEERNTKTGRD